jgi:Peptidase family S41
MKKLILLLVAGFYSVAAYSQDDLTFVLKQIRKNYFALGVPADSLVFEQYVKKVIDKPHPDTFSAISKIILFFDDPHLIFLQTNVHRSADSNSLFGTKKTTDILSETDQAIRKGDGIAGYWIDDHADFVVAITRNKENNKIVEGYAVESRNKFYTGKKIFSFPDTKSKKRIIDFIIPDGNYRQAAWMTFTGPDEFQVGHYSRWRKIGKYKMGTLSAIKVYDYTASAQVIDTGILLFRIPEHSDENIAIMDSLVDAYKDQLSKAELLIIDIRNDPGGTPRVHSRLLPYVYTNPIVRGQGYTFISEELIGYERFSLRSMDSSQNPQAFQKQKAHIDTLVARKGTLSFLSGKTMTQDSVYENPRRVAILANYACMSAAEVMLLAMRQSKKVTIFGENTAGATDNLDYFPIKAPSGKNLLFIPSFRISPIKEYGNYSKTGIVPDVLISKHEKNWVEFVIKYFEKN